MPATLTIDPDSAHYPGDPAICGMTCPEHPEAHRKHLTDRHAHNAVAKHNRDHHGEPELTLWALAELVLGAEEDKINARRETDDFRAIAAEAQRAETLKAAWCVLTGMTGARAMDYARMVKADRTIAHIATL